MVMLRLAQAERARRTLEAAAVHHREQLTLEQLLGESTTPTYAGVPVTTDSALRHSTIWGCVRLLADTISSLPLAAHRRGEREPLASLPRWLESPSAGLSLPEWLYQILVSLLLRGNAYGLVTDRAGAALLPSQVDMLHPDRVAPGLDQDGRRVYRFGGETLPAERVWHVRAYLFPGSFVGLSPIEYARQTIGLGLAAEKFGGQWFGDGSVPSGVLYTETNVGQDGAETLQAKWIEARRDNRKPAVLHGAKFEPLSIRPEESQFVETVNANVRAICRYYGVPAEMVGGETAGPLAYTSPELRSMDLLTYTVRPWLVRLETAISALLARSTTVRFNADAIVRVALLDRYQAHEVGIRAGFLTVDEAREYENRPPLERPPAPPGGTVA
jgi:HK97 family phage portal protein